MQEIVSRVLNNNSHTGKKSQQELKSQSVPISQKTKVAEHKKPSPCRQDNKDIELLFHKLYKDVDDGAQHHSKTPPKPPKN